jgi:raffinose/stachyose/melibiose transport system substrate-binding protein
MRKQGIFLLVAALSMWSILGGCGQKTEETAEESTSFTGTLRVLNTKSEVNDQIKALAQKYTQETGIAVEIIEVPAGVDAQATLKGYYLSDQMPDIIACEASGFGNWEGLLVDLSDQSWVSRTDAAYTDATYGTLGFPYTTEAIGLAYNADILEKCGVDPASITGPDALKAAIEAIDAKKDSLGLKAVVGYCSEPENLGWSSGNHIFGAYIDSGLARTDTTYIDLLNNGGQLDEERFSHYADMIGLFIQYSDPDLVIDGTYDEQVANFAAGKYAFVTQGSWIGAILSSSEDYAKAGSFAVGMVPYAFEDGMDTILTSAPSWWAVSKEGHVEEAKAFLQWCSEDSAQQILVEQAGFISPFKDCKYVASDPFASVISSYISDGKTSSWHWMDMPANLGQKGIAFAFNKYAKGELDAAGFLKEVQRITKEWYEKL